MNIMCMCRTVAVATKAAEVHPFSYHEAAVKVTRVCCMGMTLALMLQIFIL